MRNSTRWGVCLLSLVAVAAIALIVTTAGNDDPEAGGPVEKGAGITESNNG